MQKEKDNIVIITTSKTTSTNTNTTNTSSILYLNLSSNKKTTSSNILNTTTCPKLQQGIMSLVPICSDYYVCLSSSGTSCILYLCSTKSNNLAWKSYIDVPLSKLLSIPHYNYILSGDNTGKLHIWNVTSGIKYKNTPQIHNRRITALDCNGDFILSGSEDGMVCLVGVCDLFRNEVVKFSWCEHTLGVSQVVCCSGGIGVSVGKDALVVIMELFSGSTLARILVPCPITCVQVDTTCDKIYLGTKTGKIYTINISTYSASKQQSINIQHPSSDNNQETITEFVQGQQHEYEITSVKLVDNILISGDKCGFIRLWDVNELCTVKVFQPWDNTSDGKSGFRISNIVPVPDDSSKSICIPQPFQRFAKDDKEDDIIIIIPSSKTTVTNKRKNDNYKNEHYYKLLKQCKEFYEKEQSGATTKDDKDKDDSKNEEMDVLKEELKDAKSTIERWEKVNTKLMMKLNKMMNEKK